VIPSGPGLENVVRAALRKAPPEQVPLLAWPLACGSSVAARTRALEFSENVLHVQVADAGWKRELQHLAPRYLVTLNRYSLRKVERIEFVLESARRGPKPQEREPMKNRKLPR